jgi:hypothetical protein
MATRSEYSVQKELPMACTPVDGDVVLLGGLLVDSSGVETEFLFSSPTEDPIPQTANHPELLPTMDGRWCAAISSFRTG